LILNSRKERLKRTLLHQDVDFIPTQINFTAGLSKLLLNHFQIFEKELPFHLGNHMIRVDIDYPNKFSSNKKLKYDIWGVGFDTEEEGYYAAFNPLSKNKDLDFHEWPKMENPALFAQAKKNILEFGEDYFITPNIGFALFERAWTLRGLDNFLMDMAIDPGYTNELLDRITEIQLGLIHRYLDMGVDGGYFGDDYGAQKNMIFSPKMWREYIKPRLAKLFAPFTERGLPILMHSDGQIQKILPDLVEIGLTAINPVQPEVLNHIWLYENFAGKLAFYGGISTQTVLPFGTPAEVKQAVYDCINTLAPDRTGLLIAPSHRMMTDIPMDNIVAMMEAFQEYC
jgi:uroporphyrinogen decarboxylase